MITTKIKKHGQRLLQVRCKDIKAIRLALKTYGQAIMVRQGIKDETFLYFNCL